MAVKITATQNQFMWPSHQRLRLNILNLYDGIITQLEVIARTQSSGQKEGLV